MRRVSLVILSVFVLGVFSFVGARRIVAQAGASGAGLVPSRITAAIDETKLAVLRGNTHPFARSGFDRGAAPDSLSLERMMLVLQRSPAQDAALENLLAEMQDKNSANYHKWLTPDQFGRQFGASDADIQKITTWLQSHGFTVDNVSHGRNLITFSGTSGQMRTAFHTQLHQYVVKDQNHWANASDPEIPAALAGVVAGVKSMNNFFPRPSYSMSAAHNFKAVSGVAGGKLGPRMTLQDGNGDTFYLVTPSDLSTIYNFAGLWSAGITGTGETIAIVSASDINISDVNQFRSLFGLPALGSNFQKVIPPTSTDPGVVGPNANPVGGPDGDEDETEAVFDVEFSGGVAPGAKLALVASKDTALSAGIDLSAMYIVDSDLAPILTESYGACELFLGSAGNTFYKNMWSQAAAEGITVSISTGDSGAPACDGVPGSATAGAQPSDFGLAVNGIASTPYNVAVGGTDFNDHTALSPYWAQTNNGTTQASAQSYVPEVAWNDVCTSAFIYGTFGFPSAASACNSGSLQNAGNGTAFFNEFGTLWFFVAPIGGAGGVSTCTTPTTTASQEPANSQCAGGYAKPTWQAGPGVPADGHRDIPDLSLFAESSQSSFGIEEASNNTILEPGSAYFACEADSDGANNCGIGTNQSFLLAGGTSISAQVFGGMVALIEQKTGSSQGDLAPQFYATAASQSGLICNASGTVNSNCVFNDVTSGTISMPCVTGTSDGTADCTTGGNAIGQLTGFNAGTGYDQATGLGSLNLGNYLGSQPLLDVTASPTSFTAPGSTTLTFTATNGYTGTVNLTATDVPVGFTSSFKEGGNVVSSLTFSNATPQTVVFALAGQAGAPPISLRRIFPTLRTPAAVVSLAALFAAALFGMGWVGVRRRGTVALALASLAIVVAIAGCSHNSSSTGGGTTTSTVSILITNSSTNQALSVPITVTSN
jgi:subtilase family serine protease